MGHVVVRDAETPKDIKAGIGKSYMEIRSLLT